MPSYQKIIGVASKYISKNKLFKHGFNILPMYRRTTGRITQVSKDLCNVSLEIPISYKNKNYVGSIFGGSMFSAVDPIPMVQLINIIGDDFVVWDKKAEILFKRPAREKLYAEFIYTYEEIEGIKQRVKVENEIEIIKTVQLTNKSKTTVFCTIKKTLYIADKSFYKKKRNLSKV